MTLLAEAAIAVDGQRGRSLQKNPGASDVSVCLRRSSYLHHGVEPSDPREGGMAAILGTWLHEGALEALRIVYGAVVESWVGAGEAVTGHVDALYLSHDLAARIPKRYRPASQDETTVEDVKSVADDTMLAMRKREGPDPEHVLQAYIYVLLLSRHGVTVDPERPRIGLQRAVARLGPIRADRVRIRYVTRDRGREWVWEEPVQDDMLTLAARRIALVVESPYPEAMPREQDGPGLSYACDGCPFVTACWGSSEVTPEGWWPQRILLDEELATVESAGKEYLEGMRLEKQGKEIKAKAKAVLSSTPGGVYGEVTLGWGRNSPDTEEPDADAMIEFFKEAGVPVPMRPKKGRRGAISVRPT